jgi:dihydroorotase
VPTRVDLLVRGGTVVTSTNTTAADLAIADGKFVAITAPGAFDGTAAHVLDASGRYVLPGIIDGHVHFRQPGAVYKEDFHTGSRAAVMGGVTTVLDMPNTNPTTSTAEYVELKRRLAEQASYCDFGLIGLLVNENVDQLLEMAEAGVVGFKCFLGQSIGNILPPDDGVLLDGLSTIARLGMRCAFHAENNQIVQHCTQRLQAAGRRDPLAHVESRPVLAEVESIHRVGLFALHTAAKVHILHLSSRDGLQAVEEWRSNGVDLTCETAPHYCILTSLDMQRLGTLMKINPPVREPGHREALLDGLASGRIDAIATDHSPHTRDEKLNSDVWKALSGFSGVETSLRLLLTYGLHTGRLNLQRLAQATSEAPARIWGLYPIKGTIAVGSDADLTVVDVDQENTIDAARLHGKHNVTPFDGYKTRGAPVATVVRGTIVMQDGQLVAEPCGRMLRPQSSVVTA